jgi:3-deoxy-D-manno-octulosonic-acid transferase
VPNARDLVYIPLAAVTAPLWARKGREAWPERFGRVEPLGEPIAGRPRILLHAVSVGEVSALRGLVPRLAAEAEVVVSVTTDTGTARARSLFPGTRIVRYPLDFSWAVGRFLDAVRPEVVALVELEVWPNFVGACRERGIPVCVVNGRLSERSFGGYRRIRRVIGRSFESLELAAVQDEEYGRRFEAMGVAPGNCLVTGSMKWDSITCVQPGGAPDAATAALAEGIAASIGIDRSRPLIVAGSTGPTEEAVIDAACREAFPDGVQLLCAPRKPERFDEAAAALPGCVRRSEARGGGSTGSGEPHRRFLLDTIGELRAAYTLADVVVLGRSFVRLYGSDPIEPVSLGRATVIGPRVSDFESVVRALETSGGLVRATAESLGGVLRELIENPGRRAEVAARGIACIEANRGATERHAELLLEVAARVRGRGVQ